MVKLVSTLHITLTLSDCNFYFFLLWLGNRQGIEDEENCGTDKTDIE